MNGVSSCFIRVGLIAFSFFFFLSGNSLSHLENRTLLEKDTKNATKRQREGEGQE